MKRLAVALSALAMLIASAPLGAGGLPPAPAPPEVGPEPVRIPNEVVFGFVGGIPEGIEGWLAGRGGELLLRDDALGWVSARFPSEAAAEEAIAAATVRDDVRYAEHDGVVGLLLTPNDPLYPQQWGYPAIRAPQAWDITLGSHAAKVAVLDTGILTTHPDLAPNACGPFTSFVPTEPTITDGHGHGTHVSGTVAAATNNALGVAGTAQACLMGAKVLSAGGSGQWTWVAAGIVWSADNGADVISMSLGGGLPPQVVADAVAYAWGKDVLIVAAAGNSGCGAGLQTRTDGSMIWPARYDEVQAVAALVAPDGRQTAGFSSCGADMEIAAPGGGVVSTWLGNSYASLSGTSMATPHVSGVAALVKSQNPGMSAFELRCLLDLTSDDLGLPMRPLRDAQTGWGRVNAQRALEVDALLTAQGLHGDFVQFCKDHEDAIMH